MGKAFSAPLCWPRSTTTGTLLYSIHLPRRVASWVDYSMHELSRAQWALRQWSQFTEGWCTVMWKSGVWDRTHSIRWGVKEWENNKNVKLINKYIVSSCSALSWEITRWTPWLSHLSVLSNKALVKSSLSSTTQNEQYSWLHRWHTVDTCNVGNRSSFTCDCLKAKFLFHAATTLSQGPGF